MTKPKQKFKLVNPYFNVKKDRRTGKNKTEERFEKEIIKPLLWSGDVLSSMFGAVTFRLSDDCRYTPDFFVIFQDYICFYEIKGTFNFMDEKGKVKWKVASGMFPCFCWRMAAPIPKKRGGGWEIKEAKTYE